MYIITEDSTFVKYILIQIVNDQTSKCPYSHMNFLLYLLNFAPKGHRDRIKEVVICRIQYFLHSYYKKTELRTGL